MFCPKCGNEIQGDAVFCVKCGAAVNCQENTTAVEAADAPRNTNDSDNTGSPTVPKKGERQKKKKGLIIGIIVALVLIFILCTCGGCFVSGSDSGSSTNNHTDNSGSGESVKKTTVKPAVKLESPSLNYFVNGEFVVIYWDVIDAASGYDYFVDSNNYHTEYNSCEWKMDPNTSCTVKVCATSDSTEYTASDWSSVTISMPEINYAESEYGDAVFYSLSQVIEWAKTKGYQYSQKTAEDEVVLSISVKDELNSGIMSKVGRGLAGGLDGAIGGTQKGVEEASSFKSVLGHLKDNYLDDEKKEHIFGNTIDDMGNDVKQSMIEGAAQGAYTYATQNTDKRYEYHFLKGYTDHSCEYANISLEFMHREGLQREFDTAYDKLEDGIYQAASVPFHREVVMVIGLDDTSDDASNDASELYPKWRVMYIPELGMTGEPDQAQELGWKAGDCVEYGTYVQWGDTPEPIEWTVMGVTDDAYVLCSKYILDYQSYEGADAKNGYKGNGTFVRAEICRWLNTEFIDTAFTKTEQSRMLVGVNDSGNNIGYKVWLPDVDTVVYCMGGEAMGEKYNGEMVYSSPNLVCGATDYAVSKGLTVYNLKGNLGAVREDLKESLANNVPEEYKVRAAKWLLSCSTEYFDGYMATSVNQFGTTGSSETFLWEKTGIRPVIAVRK